MKQLRSALALAGLLALLVPLQSAGAATFNKKEILALGGLINGPADPYPSTIAVSGVRNVVDVNVSLHYLTVVNPGGLDVLLAGPEGQSVVLMSDLPGGPSGSPACNSASNAELTFDDQAAGPIPSGSILTSGTYQPLDNDAPTCGRPDTNDNYPNPADDPPNGTTLADFNGTNPEGDWRLFVNDSLDGNPGNIGGWTLEVVSSNKFSFGKVKKNKRKGTATLAVNVPGPGTLSLKGKGVKAQRPGRAARAMASRAVAAAGVVKLKIKAKGKAKRKLNAKGKAKVKVKVTYTPSGGSPETQSKRVKLVKTA
jgi:subtilisin-like proprotein convertase family protein